MNIRILSLTLFVFMSLGLLAQHTDQTHLKGSFNTRITRIDSYQADKLVLKIDIKPNASAATDEERYREFVIRRRTPKTLNFVVADAEGKALEVCNNKPAQGSIQLKLDERRAWPQLNPKIQNLAVAEWQTEVVASCELIDSYYNSKTELEHLNAELGKLQFDNPETLAAQHQKLQQVQAKLNAIERVLNDPRLNLAQRDPIRMLAQLPQSRAAFDKQMELYNHANSQLEWLYMQIAQKQSGVQKRATLEKALAEGRKKQSIYAPAVVELAEMDCDENKWDIALERLQSIENQRLDATMQARVRKLYMRTFDEYMSVARRQNGEQALIWLYRAQSLCELIHDTNRCSNVQMAIQSVRNKQLDELLHRASYHNSFKELADARQFAQEHQNELSNPEKVALTAADIAENHASEIYPMIEHMQYEQVYNRLLSLKEEMIRWGFEHEAVGQIGELWNSLMDLYISRAETEVLHRNYSAALERIETLERIIRDSPSELHNIPKLNELRTEIHTAVFHQLNDKLEMLIVQSKFTRADQLLDSCQNYYSTYYDWLPAESQSGLDNRRKRIRSGLYKQQYNEVETFVVQKNFTEAQRRLNLLLDYTRNQQKWLPASVTQENNKLRTRLNNAYFIEACAEIKQIQNEGLLLDAQARCLDLQHFVQQNNAWLTKDANLQLAAHFQDVAQLLHKRAGMAYRAKNRGEAEQLWLAALELLPLCDAALNTQVRTSYAQLIVDEASVLAFQSNFELATRKFDKALSLLPGSEPLYAAVAAQRMEVLQQWLGLLIGRGLQLRETYTDEQQASHLDEMLHKAAEEVDQLIVEYHISLNPQLLQQRKQLQQLGEETHCKHVAKQHQMLVLQARQELGEHRYIAATDLLYQSLMLLRFELSCNVDTLVARKLWDDYMPARNYQQLLEQRQMALRGARYGNAYEAALQLDDIASHYQVSAWGFEHESAFQHVRGANKPDYTAEALYNAAHHTKPAEANSLLNLLLQQNYPRKALKELAKRIAYQHFRSGIGSRNANDYFSPLNDKNYKKFVKYYKKGYRK